MRLSGAHVSPRTSNKSQSSKAAATARYLAMAFGIVVVLGKGTRGAEPQPMPTSTEVTPSSEVPDPSAPGNVSIPDVNTTDSASQPSQKKAKSAWRGSEIAFRNSVTAISLDRSADLTYNPFWGMALELSPRFWFDNVWSVGASIEIQREITQADDTTLRDETLISDLGVRVGASNFAKIPGVDIDLSASLGLTFPTSLASQGDTLMFALSPSLRLGRTFSSVLDGLTIGYSARFTKNFHQYTTGELESPSVPGCFVGQTGSCDRFLNTGYRNVSFRFSNGFDLSLDFTSWLSLSADFAIIVSWVHDNIDDERVSHTELEPTNTRYALAADLGLSARWWKPLEVRIGASTVNPQLRSDGDRFAPFFNRFTTLYLDLRLDVAALVQNLTEEN